MIKAVAIDDEPKALNVLQRHAERTRFLSLECIFTDPFEAITYINSNQVDLVFLDIDMPDINGLQLVNHFKSRPLIVFTTAHSEYALQSYEVEALDYLLKPFDYARFLTAVTKAQDRLQPSSSSNVEYLFINTGTQKQRIFLADLCYLSGEGNYVKYQTSQTSYLVRSSIKEALQNLPAHQFVQIHRSYIVSLPHIDKVEDNHVFIGQKALPIGATYRVDFHKRISG